MTNTDGNQSLKILALIKFVPDPNQLKVNSNGRPDLGAAPFRISTFDENAIEAGLQLCSAHGGGVYGVSVVHGKAPPRDVLLRAMAMGLEKLYLIVDQDHVLNEPYRLAAALASASRFICSEEKISEWDLLICGEASADQYNAQVGPRLATALDIPVIAYATRIEIRDSTIVADRALEDRSETLQASLPCVVTVGMEINQARIPTVLQVMGAGRKPIREVLLADLPGLDVESFNEGPSLSTLDVLAPVRARKNIIVEGNDIAAKAAELLAKLGADGEVKF